MYSARGRAGQLPNCRVAGWAGTQAGVGVEAGDAMRIRPEVRLPEMIN